MPGRGSDKGPPRGPLALVLKFAGAALFGCLVSLLLFLASWWIDPESFWGGWWPNLFWIIPVVWGVLGIFWFEPLLKLAKTLFDTAFNIHE